MAVKKKKGSKKVKESDEVKETNLKLNEEVL